MARPLKVFTVHSHASYVPHHIINDVIGAPSHVRQGNIFVVARTKKDASTFLGEKLGGRYKVSEIDEARGIHFEAFAAATSYLSTEADAYEGRIAVSWGRGNETYAVETFIHGWKVVGETTHQDPENERNFLKKPIFVPAKPEPKPVRLVIELDAHTDPRVIEVLRAASSVFVKDASSPVGKVASGKVVES